MRKSEAEDEPRSGGKQARTRSRSAMETIANEVEFRSLSNEPKLKQVNKKQTGKALKKPGVKRKIQFGNSKSPNTSSDKQNNASPGVGTQRSNKQFAISDPNAVDRHIGGDGIVTQVDLHPNENESDFDYESEYDADDENHNEQDQPLSNDDCNRNENRNQAKTDEDEFDALFDDDKVKRLFNKMLDQRVDAKLKEHKLVTTMTVVNAGKTPMQKNKVQEGGCREVVKSPSDTTLYTRAVKKSNRVINREGIITENGLNGRPINRTIDLVVPQNLPTNRMINVANLVRQPQTEAVTAASNDREHDLMNKISNFVESIRMNDAAEAGPSGSGLDGSYEQVLGFIEARRRSDKSLLDAEKYKAIIVEPPEPGESHNNLETVHAVGGPVFSPNAIRNEPVVNTGSGISDDDFFHLMCHVDSTLVSKIEKGEFVDLEKLLPKDKKRKMEENRLEWVYQEGNTFLAPVSERMNKITGVRCWEQAFRVYATIYCSVHPGRAKEIWQYIAVINMAASSFIWENVYEYDITFRHLMAFNPNQSWAITYNQMWNICMRDPIPKNNFNNGSSRGGVSTWQSRGTGHNGGGASVPGQKRKKSDYCWNFNKGITCKYGKKCRFVERCSYCDSDSHGLNKCTKLEKDRKPVEDAK